MRRIALFGGTFDPPHRGHVAIAEAAADAFELEQVLFAPVGRQPLKSRKGAGDGATFEQRLAMVRLVCEVDARFVVSDVDAPRADGQPNYTVDALTRVVAEHAGEKVFNLVGADSFAGMARWREPARLLELAEWIVVSRPGFALAEPVGMRLTEAQRAKVHLLDSVHEDVAATGLRERLHAGDACADVLTAGVSAYIRREHLYLGGR